MGNNNSFNKNKIQYVDNNIHKNYCNDEYVGFSKNNYILRLPNEILFFIFTYLSIKDFRKGLYRVCYQFYITCNDEVLCKQWMLKEWNKYGYNNFRSIPILPENKNWMWLLKCLCNEIKDIRLHQNYDINPNLSIQLGKGHWITGGMVIGEWLDGQPHGHTITVFLRTGTFHVGEYKYGSLDGYGICKWKDGRVYQGYWKDNKGNGYGTLSWEDNRSYTGEFRNGKHYGEGVPIYPDGTPGMWEQR